MVFPRPHRSHDEVDQLLRNARLRDELEPFVDESLDLLQARRMSTPAENEYLESMLAWERAPVLPISLWFQPELCIPAPETLDDLQLNDQLSIVVERLYEKRIILEFTDHLSDRELYCLIYRDILRSLEKKIDRSDSCIRWHCLDVDLEPELWLRYYASEEERLEWQAQSGEPLPPCEFPPHPRSLPGHS